MSAAFAGAVLRDLSPWFLRSSGCRIVFIGLPLSLGFCRFQALQQQLYGGQASAWNFGAAYRIPDTNINLSGTYQQGKANLQVPLSMEDDGEDVVFLFPRKR